MKNALELIGGLSLFMVSVGATLIALFFFNGCMTVAVSPPANQSCSYIPAGTDSFIVTCKPWSLAELQKKLESERK